MRAATNRGYATFNIDRMGVGASDHPAGSLVTLPAQVYIIHQVVQALRDGVVASPGFDKVIVVGHSLGSMITINYANSYPGEADGIILTGYLHDMNLFFPEHVIASFYPATLDPKFAGQSLYSDYFTTQPGTRADAFYYMGNVDPAVIDADENLKQTITIGELTGGASFYDPAPLIQGPVLDVIGQYDYAFCGNLVNCSDRAAVQTYEAGFYSSSACLETAVINDAGHVLNLHLNAGATYSQMLSWADRTVGSTAEAAPQPCAAP